MRFASWSWSSVSRRRFWVFPKKGAGEGFDCERDAGLAADPEDERRAQDYGAVEFLLSKGEGGHEGRPGPERGAHEALAVQEEEPLLVRRGTRLQRHLAHPAGTNHDAYGKRTRDSQ